jgi:heat shock protein 5
MARSQSGLFMGLSAFFYLVLLFSPLAFLQTAQAAEQDPLQESYGTGMLQFT